MRPRGIIYDSRDKRSYKEILIALPRRIKFGYFLVRTLGSSLVSFAIIAFLFNYGPIIREEFNYYFNKGEGQNEVASLIETTNAREEELVRTEAESLGLNAYFSINIPKIDAKAQIVANVDSGNKAEYLEALKSGVAHAAGTFFPGQGRNIFLFAHSTDSALNYARYNAVFYLLGKLEEKTDKVSGDQVTIYFADKKYEYEVEEVLIVDADDTEWMTRDFGGERLILQTCNPPGTTWKRLLVIAKPVIYGGI